jgi:WD40 repeat protein
VVWDTRNAKQPVHYFNADSSALYSVQFATHNRHVFATGGEEKLIKLWDLRNMACPITSMADINNQ